MLRGEPDPQFAKASAKVTWAARAAGKSLGSFQGIPITTAREAIEWLRASGLA